MARIGFLTWSDVRGPAAFSGSPHSIRTALQILGHEIVELEVGPTRLPESTPRSRSMLARLAPGARTAAKHLVGPLTHRRSRTLRRARGAAEIADRNIARLEPDLVVGMKMSRVIGLLETTRPILHISDATAAVLLPQYPSDRWKGAGHARAIQELESLTLQRADHSMLYFQGLVDSAIRDHGADPDRISVNYPGANLSRGNGPLPLRTAPSRDGLELLIVASDPIRKRLSFAVEVVERLNARGWKARIRYVGPEHPATANPHVESLGRLRLDDPRDRTTHVEALGRSHLNLLPSSGDMMPLSVQEAGNFGVPSVVTDVGGLPEAVSDRDSGRVLGLDRTPDDWADAIEWCVADEERYRTLCHRSMERAQTIFTWEAWAERARPVIEDLVRRTAPSTSPDLRPGT